MVPEAPDPLVAINFLYAFGTIMVSGFMKLKNKTLAASAMYSYISGSHVELPSKPSHVSSARMM